MVIALLPKVAGATRLSEFRPISLCNTVYKIISKIIGSRLKLITPLAVQRNHVGFITGRLLCENVPLASELVADFNKPGKVSRGCLQIDITKAYDNVDWQFVLIYSKLSVCLRCLLFGFEAVLLLPIIL